MSVLSRKLKCHRYRLEHLTETYIECESVWTNNSVL